MNKTGTENQLLTGQWINGKINYYSKDFFHWSKNFVVAFWSTNDMKIATQQWSKYDTFCKCKADFPPFCSTSYYT